MGDAVAASQEIDALVAGLADWRGDTLAQVRRAILDADAGITEAWKWRGSPVWEKAGVLVVGNAHKAKVKLTFMHGAQLPDPHSIFNAGLDGGQWRAIDMLQGDRVRTVELQALVRAAVAFNCEKAVAMKAR